MSGLRSTTVVAIGILFLKYRFVSSISPISPLLPEDATLDTVGLATKYGHPPMEYKVVTEDNYILTIYRLPGESRQPILLMNGILDSSDTFLLRGENSLAITLANEGYDVWLGNHRGNRYSKSHIYLDPEKDAKFWDFGYHEVGYYDLPATIDKVLQETKAHKITAIGHSLGNTIFYVLGSTRSEYNSKINVLIALAPICYLHHSVFVSKFAPFTPQIELFFKTFEVIKLFGDNNIANRAFKALCVKPATGYAACAFGFLFPLSGIDVSELEPSFFPVVIEHFLTEISTKLLLQYLQNARSKTFSRYDYGGEKNLLVYNSTNPPLYDLKKVTMPIALLTGRNDNLASVEDVDLLRKQLPNVVYNLIVPRPLMNHADFLWGRTMDVYLYPYIYEVLGMYGFHKNSSVANVTRK